MTLNLNEGRKLTESLFVGVIESVMLWLFKLPIFAATKRHSMLTYLYMVTLRFHVMGFYHVEILICAHIKFPCYVILSC
ncbi:hypothetical protein KSS87_015892 [Heliosperma pusillum]|nr:hypothetical protein KSS87_015892 [Heliosperma pusillum]